MFSDIRHIKFSATLTVNHHRVKCTSSCLLNCHDAFLLSHLSKPQVTVSRLQGKCFFVVVAFGCQWKHPSGRHPSQKKRKACAFSSQVASTDQYVCPFMSEGCDRLVSSLEKLAVSELLNFYYCYWYFTVRPHWQQTCPGKFPTALTSDAFRRLMTNTVHLFTRKTWAICLCDIISHLWNHRVLLA